MKFKVQHRIYPAYWGLQTKGGFHFNKNMCNMTIIIIENILIVSERNRNNITQSYNLLKKIIKRGYTSNHHLSH